MVLMVLRSKKTPNVKSDNKKCTCKIFEDVSFEKSLKLSAAVSLLELGWAGGFSRYLHFYEYMECFLAVVTRLHLGCRNIRVTVAGCTCSFS